MSTVHEPDTIKEAVRDRYAGAARAKSSCCGTSSGCCGGNATDASSMCGTPYEIADLADIPSDADLGLGCGNPLAIESVREGEVVVDLGAGGGVDCFLAARRVGDSGRVIGVDMTPEMVLLALRNARTAGITNVDFRLGEIEDLPVEDGIADLVISNCVINLVPDKPKAFAEALRVLKPGGRISVSDVVTTEPLPDGARESVGAYVSCLGGAAVLDDYLAAARAAGFADVRVASETAYAVTDEEAEALLGTFELGDIPREDALRAVRSFRSVTVQAVRPTQP